MDRDTESYILDHSSPEDPLLNELYRFTYLHMINPNMAAGHMQGKFLEFLTFMKRPTLALEIGTYTGYSAISIAQGLPPEGVLHTVEENDELKCISNRFIIKAGMKDKIVTHTGKAQTIVPGLSLLFDLIYVDGDKREYVEYYHLALSVLAPGGIIIADNVLWGGKAPAGNSRDPQTKGIVEFNEVVKADKSVHKLIMPVRDGIMLIRRDDKMSILHND